MRKISLFMLTIFIASIAIFTAEQAFAKRTITIINNRSKTLYTAYRFQDYREGKNGGTWSTQGWTVTKPGQTKNITAYTNNNIVYVYTQEINPIREWIGDPNDSRDNVYWISTSGFFLQGNNKPNTGSIRKVRFKRYTAREGQPLKLTYKR